MAVLNDILFGAITRGVNKPTVALLNVSLLGCTLALVCLLVFNLVSEDRTLAPHIAFLIFLSIGLTVLINWFITQVGLVTPEEQQAELFAQQAAEGEGAGAAGTAAGPGDRKKQR